MNSTVFTHEPLQQPNDSIRLLTVLPQGSNNALISCSIHHADPSVDYCCLSYLWGPTGNERSILINGKSFNVRTNLWTFLNVAQQRYTNVALWIDALCINQNDDQEKSHQVRMMGRIYSAARLVYIWLGLEKFPQGALERVRTHTKTHSPICVDDYYETDHLEGMAPCWTCEKEAKQIASLCTDEYWTRAWIVQEVLLAREKMILHGGQSISWADYTDIWTATINPGSGRSDVSAGQHTLNDLPFPTTFHSGQLRPRTLHDTPLKLLLDEFPDLQCSRHHDRIFSLLGLAVGGDTFPVDYGISREALFLEALRSSPSNCICMMRQLLKTMYSQQQQEEFLRTLKDDYASRKIRTPHAFLEITLNWHENFRRAKIGWLDVDQKDGEYKATINLTTCAFVPREIDLVISGIPQKRQWRCVAMVDPFTWVGEEITSEITLRVCPQRSKWVAILSERAIVALAIASRISDELAKNASEPNRSHHDCGNPAMKAVYRFTDHPNDSTGGSTANSVQHTSSV